MSKQYLPTGPAESMRTREFAEAEWSRLVSSSARDKNSFLTELMEINDRIIGLKQSLPPLNIPQTVSYQEKPKDYGFVVDSNMRVASAMSLSNAKGLRENLSRMMAQQAPQSASYRPGESNLTRNETKRTDFDILAYARQAEPDTRSVYIHQEPPMRAVDGYFVPSSEHRHESEEARKDAEFARALDAYRSTRPPALEEPQSPSEKQSSALSPVVERPESVESGAHDEEGEEEGDEDEELEEGVSDDDEDHLHEGEEGEEGGDDERKPQAYLEPRQPVAVHGHGAANSTPAVPLAAAPTESSPVVSAHEPVPVNRQPAAAPHVANTAPTAVAAPQAVSTLPVSVPIVSKPSAEEPRSAPTSAEPAQDGSEQLTRLQAWEKELQEREQKVLQYMNSLSRPIGAKMAPKPLHDDSEPEHDLFEQRYGGRRRDEGQSALRGSADIHIHNHIAPPITIPAYAPQPAPAPRSSLYDSYQRSTFTPSKYECTPTAEAPREFATPNVQPSIQTRYPQRSEIRSNYAFPPAPYSSLNSGASNVDLSGLSLERMRELTGHY